MDIKQVSSHTGKGVTDKSGLTSVDSRLVNPDKSRTHNVQGENNAVEVKLSHTAEVAKQALSELDKVSDVRHDRVAELKAAVADGSYQINAERLAAALLSIDRQLPK